MRYEPNHSGMILRRKILCGIFQDSKMQDLRTHFLHGTLMPRFLTMLEE